MDEGIPKCEIHPLMNAWATDSAVMLVSGMASGQRENEEIEQSFCYIENSV